MKNKPTTTHNHIIKIPENLQKQEDDIRHLQNLKDRSCKDLEKSHCKYNLKNESFNEKVFIASNDELQCSEFKAQQIERRGRQPSKYNTQPDGITEVLNAVATKLKAIEQEQSNINLNNK